ncbi:hypothetical protein SAPIO_CDS3123 [Scedosporium apiospermum]|uniref:Uncharacterized protein n=1 Tax=Pseudallescheria apiosperma TaxID=563466 RepID=A0A084GA31_PSEDA|nr:uncharacterized protein SAPIO_CDS3123 [Scedosporium apiospermum]KEZ44193.1 hypothetical protein SAPIO_CDS3123 [Scedosporium apiospermum]
MIQLVNLIIRVKTRKYFACNPGIYECFDIGRKEVRLCSGTANYLKRLDGKRISAWFQGSRRYLIPHRSDQQINALHSTENSAED